MGDIMNDFTRIIEENSIKMGYISGSDKVLFIKCGQGGSIYGYDNKYLKIACSVNEKYGYSVFVSETLNDKREVFQREMNIVKTLVNKDCRINFLGVSKGGLLILWHCCDGINVKHITAINAPLMINFHNRTRPAIQRIGRENITMFYGTEDPSYSYVPFLASQVNIEIIQGADHNLVGGKISFEDIVESIINTKH